MRRQRRASDALCRQTDRADGLLVSHLDAEVGPTAASLRDAAGSAKSVFDQGKTTIANLDAELTPAMADIRQLVRDVDGYLAITTALNEALHGLSRDIADAAAKQID